MIGYLQLEDGTIFEGKLTGCIKEETIGEVVFNTSMFGYQEILTDPSYYGQIVVMTYPLVGNYGINFDYSQSSSVKVNGFVVDELCEYPNNFNTEMTIRDYLKNEGIFAIEKIDTRSLVKIIRNKGSMKGIITSRMLPKSELASKLEKFDNSSAIKEVSTKEIYKIKGNKKDGLNIAVMDFGIKNNIIETLKMRVKNLTIYPYNVKDEVILNGNFDGVFLSNGPGNPKDLNEVIDNVKNLIGKIPITGIGLGHQLFTLAAGGNTENLKYGHRGGNHPVKDINSGKIFMTSQNHGYVVTELPRNVEITHINLNDKSIEGMKDESNNIYTVQFHPDACTGPGTSGHIFDEFITMMKQGR